MARFRTFAALLAVCLAAAACKTEGTNASSSQPSTPSQTPSGPTIPLNASSVQQTISGWEVPVLSTVRDYSAIVPFIDRIMDQAVNDLGLNRISVGVFPGLEGQSSSCQAQYLAGTLNEASFLRTCAYNPANDDTNAFSINPNGFSWLLLDWEIDNIVLPMKRQLDARGEKLFVTARYVDFSASPFEHKDNPEEYAEFMLAVFEHIQSKYGFSPDGIDLINEPDLAVGWGEGGTIGRLAAAAGRRLAAAGFRPAMIGPSTTNKAAAVPYFDAMLAQPGASSYLKEIGWHCYADSGFNSAGSLATKAVEYGVLTSQTECWTTGNHYQALLQELKASRNSSWSMGPIHAPNGYYSVSSNGDITLRDRPKYMRQYYKYVRAGARRIAAASSTDQFDPVAFINTDGRYVVVVRAGAAGSFTVTNLPAGTYGIYSTTGPDPASVTAFDVTAPDQTVGANGQLTTSIQGMGVITVYAKAPSANRLGGGSDSDARVVPDSEPAPQAMAAATPGSSSLAPSSIVTKDGMHLVLEWVPGELNGPVDLALTGDHRAFVAEPTRIMVVRDGAVLARPAATLEIDPVEGQEELRAVAVDPQFAQTHFVYTISTSGRHERSFRVSRYSEVDDRLLNRVVILDDVAARTDASAALRFAPDGTLFAAFDHGGHAERVHDRGSYNGKVLRLNADGTTPRDQAGGTPLFALGYHSPRGLDWEQSGKALWLADSRDQGWLDLLDTDARGTSRLRASYRLPADLEPSSLAVYRGTSLPLMRDNVLIASASGRDLLRLTPDSTDPLRAPAGERLLGGDLGAIRAVAVDRAGTIYLATEHALGMLVPQPHVNR